MNEEGNLDLLPFFLDEDDEDRMLDEGVHTLQAPALLSPVSHLQQLRKYPCLAARLVKVKQLARSQIDFDVGIPRVRRLLQAVQLVGDDFAPLVNGEKGLQHTLVFLPTTKVIHQGDVSFCEKLAKFLCDVLLLSFGMFPASGGLPLIQPTHESPEYAAHIILSFTGFPAAFLIRCVLD